MAKPKTKESPKRSPLKSATAKPTFPKPSASKPGIVKSRNVNPTKAKVVATKRLTPQAVGPVHEDRLKRLWSAVQEVREGRRDSPRTARLLAAGPPKLAQKVVEEAAEVAIEAVIGKRDALVSESVDLLYNLVALWNGLGVQLPAIWAEMDRREAMLGMAEKLPKAEEI